MIIGQRNDLPAEIPPELNRWNWGAFLLNWIWGVGNGTYIALLTLIPFFGILVMPFVLGAKGSAWAWRNGRWDSVEHFKRVQRLWAIWGVVVLAGFILFFVGTFGGVFYALANSEAYRLSVIELQKNADVVEAVGTPFKTGFPTGGVTVSGETGNAFLTFSVTGPKGSGVATTMAIKRAGVWLIQRLVLKVDGRDDVIDLVHPTSALREPASPHAAPSPRKAA
jgi:hypothetical protein